jgi:hypothetical protein
MKAVVVIVARSLEVHLWVGKLAGRSAAGKLPQSSEANACQAKLAIKSADDQESTSPFWTWFIENPRSFGTA